MSCILQDVNLSNVQMSTDGRTISIGFIDMFDGKCLGHLSLESVLVFRYFNAFESSEDSFPAYVGKVICRELVPDEITAELVNLGYRFIAGDGQIFIPSGKSLFLIHIEGGEVSIEIICGKYLLNSLDTAYGG